MQKKRVESTEDPKVIVDVKMYFILVFVVQFQGTNWKQDLYVSSTRFILPPGGAEIQALSWSGPKFGLLH